MKRWAWGVAGAALLVAVVALVLLGQRQLDRFEALAVSAKNHGVAGLLSLRAKQADPALTSFRLAREEFRAARDLLGPGWLHGVPWIGRQLAAADDLTTIGVAGASAGAEASALLDKMESLSGDDRLGQFLTVARPHVDSALAALVTVADRADGLSSEGLWPELASAVTEVQTVLEPMQVVLDRSHAMLDLERHLFSSQHRFLVVSQNSAELRPTGGFMGTFGLVELGPAGFNLNKYADIYTLPLDTLDLPLPDGGQVNYKHFYFRNTNWWMDFPTSAGVMMQFWQNMQQPQIDGIIAIDIPMIRDLLTIFGPIKVPESDVPITAENVMEHLTYVVEYETSGGRGQKGKKEAVVSMATELMRRLTHLGDDQLRPTMESLKKSADEKHIQLWFTDPAAQAAAVTVGWSGAIAPPPGTTDLLAVSNGVIKPSKANIGVRKTLAYDVALQADGTAETTLHLGYRKNRLRLKGVPQHWLANYVRAHRLAGTVLDPASDSEFRALRDATGLPTFGHYFRLDLGGSTTVEMKSRVPNAVQGGPAGGSSPSASGADGATSHYRLLVARQADLLDTDATVEVTIPPGWRTVAATARFRSTGDPVPTSMVNGTIAVKTTLKQDLLLDVELVRN